MTIDRKMHLTDVIRLRTGDFLSDEWYRAVYKPLFHPRRCSVCGQVRNCMGCLIAGTTKFADRLIFGFREEYAESIMKALDLESLCEPCLRQRQAVMGVTKPTLDARPSRPRRRPYDV